jgi:hypothetical protein
MHLVERHRLVRLLSTQGLSASHVLSRPRVQWPATLTRYSEEDWVASPDGRVFPAMRSGVGWSGVSQMSKPTFGHNTVLAAQNAVALSTNYTYNSAGAAIGARVSLPTGKTLNGAYYFVTVHTGTPQILFELRDDNANKAGTTVHASATSTPGGTGWKSFTGMSFAMTAGTKYWAVIADPDGATAGTATVLRSINGNTSIDVHFYNGYSTTDGWVGQTSASVVGSILLVFSDSTTMGWPITAAVLNASNTNRRGWNLSTGFTEQLKILGMLTLGTALTNGSGIEAYEGTALPGSPAASSTVAINTAGTGQTAGFVFDPPYSAPKATAVRVVFTYSGNSTTVHHMQIGTGSDAVTRRALWGGGSFYYAGANDAIPDWSNDGIDEQPSANLIIEDQVAITGGGGGGLLTHPGMMGGVNA